MRKAGSATSARPRSSRRSARCLSDQVFVAGRTVVYERVEDYWAKDLNVNVGRDNFDEMRFEYFATPRSRSRPSRPTISTGGRRTARRTGPRLRFPSREGKRVILEEFPVNATRGIMQAFVSTPGATSSRTRGCVAPQLRLRFRGDEQADLLRPVQAHHQLLRGHGAGLFGAAARAGARDPRERCATRCRRRFSRRPTPIRSAAARRRCAQICGRAWSCSRKRATRSATSKLVNIKTGETFDESRFCRRRSRARSASSSPTSRRSRSSASN